MNELTNAMSNINLNSEIKYYEMKVECKNEKFKDDNGIISRYSKFKQKWLLTCNLKTAEQCKNFQTYNGFCKKHQKCVIKDKTIPYYYGMSIIGTLCYLCDYNDKTYRISNITNCWNEICKFTYKNDENFNCDRCINFSKNNDCYCERHKNGVDNERKSNTLIGDLNEEFICDLMLNRNEFIDVKKIGRENSELDITYKIKEEYDSGLDQIRGIQIKTLSYLKDYGYHINDIDGYSNSTVIVGLSKDKKYFCIFFKSVLKDVSSLYIDFNKPKIEHRQNIFYGLDDKTLGYTFMDMLIHYSKHSTLYDNSIISNSNLKERDSINRIETKCKYYNLNFKYADSSDSQIDCIINNKNIQCKYSTYLNKKLYQIKLYKNKNTLICPYEDTDNIDFFIFETEIKEFYVIPISVLIYFGYIKTQNNKGKTTIKLCPSSHTDNHWSKHFINRFDLLSTDNVFNINSILDMTNVINIFNYQCYLNGITSLRNMENLSSSICTIKDKNVKCLKSTKLHRLNYTFTIQYENKIPYNISMDLPDFFVLYIDGPTKWFYIFPKQILIDQHIIGDQNNKGSRTLGLPVPGASTIKENKFWSQPYVNAFGFLNF